MSRPQNTFSAELTSWLHARAGEISLVWHDITRHVQPPPGPSFTFAVFTVLLVIFLWKFVIPLMRRG